MNIENKLFKIRTSILNMSLDKWSKLRKIYGVDTDGEYESTIITSPRYFLDNIGLTSTACAELNNDEKKFIEILYTIYRAKKS